MNVFMGFMAMFFCVASIGSDTEHEQEVYATASYVVIITMAVYNLVRLFV